MSPSHTAAICAHVAEVDVGDELGDQQEQEEQAGDAGPRLRDHPEDVGRAPDRAYHAPVGDPRRQEGGRDHHDQTAHERRVADDVAGVGVAKRRAGGQRECRDDDQHRDDGQPGVAQTPRLERRVDVRALLAREFFWVGEAAVPGAEPRLDDAGRDEGDDDGEEQGAADAEVEVRDEVDLRARVDQRGRLVGDVDQHRVRGDDQDVDAEGRADRAEAGGEAGQRVAPDAQERGRRQRVAGVDGDAREDPDEDDDVGQRDRRRARGRDRDLRPPWAPARAG
jgi:hypothetical protein